MNTRWYLDRLRAMSPAEVAHRALRAARRPIDRARMRAGTYAPTPHALRGWSGPARFYALDGAPARADDDERIARDRIAHDQLAHDADRICAGEREVLGLGWLVVGDAPWHLEPLARTEWPRIESTRVMRAAPPHFDARLTWELNRGHDWVILARAGRTDALRASLASWRAANPVGIGINWASAMEAAIRIHALAWVAALARDNQPAPVGAGFAEPVGPMRHDQSPSRLDEQIAPMLHEHAVFVERNLSRYSSANNHLLVELSALAIASRVLWSRPHARALAELEVELARQVYADGVNAEMATHYHAFVLEAALLVTHLERTWGAPRPALGATARRMADYLWHLRTASGAYLEQGDSDEGKIIPLLDADALVAAAHAATLVGGTLPPLPSRSRVFRDSGQVVLRSPRLHVTFDAGPFGYGTLAAHAHCDALAVNVAIDGKPFLVDRGTYRYNGDRAARDRFRLTAAHNTLQVDGKEQAQPAGPFLWRTRPTVTLERCDLSDARDVVVASHDGFGTRHRRTLVREGDVLVVIDECAEPATVRWHLAPDAAPHRVWTSHPGRVWSTPHSPRYGQLGEAPTHLVRFEGGLLISALAPSDIALDELISRASSISSARRP